MQIVIYLGAGLKRHNTAKQDDNSEEGRCPALQESELQGERTASCTEELIRFISVFN